MTTETATPFMEGIRERVRERIPKCGQCGTVMGSLPATAAEIGISRTTLWRFLEAGGGLSGDTLDKVMTWLEWKPPAREGA